MYTRVHTCTRLISALTRMFPLYDTLMPSSFLRYQIIDADRVTLFIVDAEQNDLFCKVEALARGVERDVERGVERAKGGWCVNKT